jgi:hypothetical protein
VPHLETVASRPSRAGAQPSRTDAGRAQRAAAGSPTSRPPGAVQADVAGVGALQQTSLEHKRAQGQ